MIKLQQLHFPQKRKSAKNLIAKKLRDEGKIDDKTELLIAKLSLEELLALKLELVANNLLTKRFLGFPIFRSLEKIVKTAIIHHAFSTASSIKEACLILGISHQTFKTIVKRYKPPMEHLEDYQDVFGFQ